MSEIDRAIISIHVPTRGTTCKGCKFKKCFLYFNPRSYERNDSSLLTCLCISIHISIHVPTRGTTIF